MNNFKLHLGSAPHIINEQIETDQKSSAKPHKDRFPLELPSLCVKLASKRGDTVLDPFAGSCTTGVAALELGRKFVGIDIDANFYKVGKQRLENYAK